MPAVFREFIRQFTQNLVARLLVQLRQDDGQELRLLDIAVDMGGRNKDGSAMGVWQDLRGFESSAAAADALKSAGDAHYGHAGPEFLKHLTARRDEALEAAAVIVNAFVEDVAKVGDTGQARRAAKRFAAIAAAGELATMFGVVPWEKGTAAAAAAKLYHRWATAFGRDRNREETEILRRLKEAVEADAQWGNVNDSGAKDDEAPRSTREGEARSLAAYGWKRIREKEKEVTYLFKSSAWEEVFKGHNLVEVARIVDTAGFLDRSSEGGRFQCKVSVHGQKHWLYCVRGSITEADLGDG